MARDPELDVISYLPLMSAVFRLQSPPQSIQRVRKLQYANMEPTDNMIVSPVRRARNQHACQYCRTVKARCLPSDQAGICQRCLKSKRECIIRENQPRPKRVRPSNSRVAQVEQKLDGLYALLSRQPESAHASSVTGVTSYARQAPSSSAPGKPLPYYEVSGYNENPGNDSSSPARSHKSGTRASSYEGETYYAESEEQNGRRTEDEVTLQAQIPPKGELRDGFANGIVGIVEAENILHEFRTMIEFFPFITLSPTATAQELSSQKPLLLLAALMTASYSNRPLQSALEQLYKNDLASRVIVHAQKSLDALQSILVYLAWYHYHFNPRTQQLGQLLQLAIGIAIDLGINQKPKKPLIDISGRSLAGTPPPHKQREAQRAYLGCYYLSTAFATALSRPNLLKYTDWIKQCCDRLSTDMEYPLDGMLSHMIALNHIGDQINETFRLEDTDVVIANDRHQMHLDLMKSVLNSWESQVPSDFNHGDDSSYDFLNMELHSIGLRITPSTNASSESCPVSITKHLDTLFTCLESGKAFLDKLLSIPVTRYRHICFIHWMRLPYVLVIVSKLSFPSPKHTASQWDTQKAQDRVRLDLYLESLCYRMQSITSSLPNEEPDFFATLKLILEKTRYWYMRKTHSAAAEDDGEAAATTATEQSPLEIIQNPHENGSQSHHQENQPPHHHNNNLTPILTATSHPPPAPATPQHMNPSDPTAFNYSPDMDDPSSFLAPFDESFWTSELFGGGFGQMDPPHSGGEYLI